MKRLFLFFLVGYIPLSGLAQAKQQIWKLADRQNLISELRKSQLELIQEVEHLSDKQLRFKPDSTKWSIAEVVEHLGVYEELLYWDLLNNQYTEERYDLVDSVKGIDSAMNAYATEPSKGQAPFAAQPLGRFKEKDDLLLFFNRYRNEVVTLVQETKTDFRLHFIFRPADWGIWHIRDLHQYTLLWISHTRRHVNQIRTIKTMVKYPE